MPRNKVLRGSAALLAVLLLLLQPDLAAGIEWPEAKTEAQVHLQEYISRVNENLASLQSAQVNSIFELYTFTASLGITQFDASEIPEDSELSFSLYDKTLNSLVLRVCVRSVSSQSVVLDTNGLARFRDLAAACVHAASPESGTLQERLAAVSSYTSRAEKNPGNSFEEKVSTLNGETTRVYFAYCPNEYMDGGNWLQLTVIFPLAGSDGGGVTTDASAPENEDAEPEYNGYFVRDDSNHYEVYVTATPEPDSPAGGFWDTGK